jgi:hypothetical protein
MLRTELSEICDRVSDVADREDVEEFILGATSDVARCRARLGAEDVIPIYEADCMQEASDVEDALIDHFATHPKCGNEPEHEYDDRNMGDDEVVSVYVAVWWKV